MDHVKIFLALNYRLDRSGSRRCGDSKILTFVCKLNVVDSRGKKIILDDSR